MYLIVGAYYVAKANSAESIVQFLSRMNVEVSVDEIEELKESGVFDFFCSCDWQVSWEDGRGLRDVGWIDI